MTLQLLWVVIWLFVALKIISLPKAHVVIITEEWQRWVFRFYKQEASYLRPYYLSVLTTTSHSRHVFKGVMGLEPWYITLWWDSVLWQPPFWNKQTRGRTSATVKHRQHSAQSDCMHHVWGQRSFTANRQPPVTHNARIRGPVQSALTKSHIKLQPTIISDNDRGRSVLMHTWIASLTWVSFDETHTQCLGH